MLNFNYTKAMAQVQELRDIADAMEKNSKLSEAMDKVKTAWEGQSSQDFQNKISQLTDLVKNEVKNIRDIATGLEKSAKAIAEAEKAAVDALNTNTVRNT